MKILLLTQNKVDTTSFYRANGVFKNLNKQMAGKLQIDSYDRKAFKLSWADLVLYDLVFMQRPFDNTFLNLARYIKDLSIPLWIDYDDNLLAIPQDNPSFETYSNPQIKKNIVEFLKIADVVTVSTNELKNQFFDINKKVVVIPNALNTEIFKIEQLNTKRNNVIMWRGSNTHQYDLFSFMGQIHNIATNANPWQLVFFGFYPWMLSNFENVKHYPTMDVLPYHKNIKQLAPNAMMVPLADHLFNRCKSNIAALEGIFAGAVCVVPNWDEWQIPGTFKYNDPNQFQNYITDIYTGKVTSKDILDLNKNAREFILDNYSLDVVNKKRVEIIKTFS